MIEGHRNKPMKDDTLPRFYPPPTLSRNQVGG